MEVNAELVLTVLGAALCLCGWIMFWIGSRLLGIGLGLGFGFVFATLLGHVMRIQPGGQALVLLSCSLFGALGGFLLVRAVTTFLFGILGFLFGALLGRIGVDVYYLVNNQAIPALTTVTGGVIVGCGAFVALMALWLQKYILILITSYVGASFLVVGVPYLQAHEVWALLGLFGFAVLWQSFLASLLLRPRQLVESEQEAG